MPAALPAGNLASRRGKLAALTMENLPDPEDLQRLADWTMPFGKYQGRRLAELPGNYLGWFARQGFPPGQLGRLLALLHEIDHNDLRGLLAPLRRPSGGGGR